MQWKFEEFPLHKKPSAGCGKNMIFSVYKTFRNLYLFLHSIYFILKMERNFVKKYIFKMEKWAEEDEKMQEDFVKLKDVTKVYQMGEVTIRAVDGINLNIAKGEFAVIVGPSGAGKTTVLNILGGMDTASSGEVWVDGYNVAKYNQKKLTGYRRDDIGFVFQFYNLVPNLTTLENVELASQICKNSLDARTVLKEVGLGERLGNFPAQLSGGEQQRVSIARALAKNPKLLLCDEPTGALDYQTGKAILKLLQDTCREKGMTVIVITHNSAIAPMADRVIKIKNGQVSEMKVNPNPVSVETIEW